MIGSRYKAFRSGYIARRSIATLGLFACAFVLKLSPPSQNFGFIAGCCRANCRGWFAGLSFWALGTNRSSAFPIDLMSELTHTKAIAVFLFSIIGCLLTADAVRVTAAEGEFPAEWYFDSMQGMREKLEGRPAPEISTDKWIGDETTLADCRGKVVVLDFWATWCGPCIASIPKNIDLVKQHPDDLVFIGSALSRVGMGLSGQNGRRSRDQLSRGVGYWRFG